MNRIIRKHLSDGSLTGGEAMCDRHINEYQQKHPDVIEVTSASTGARCVACLLEESNDQVVAVPVAQISTLMADTFALLDADLQKQVMESPALKALTHGFIHAMLLCGVESKEIPEKTKLVLSSCWTRPTNEG